MSVVSRVKYFFFIIKYIRIVHRPFAPDVSIINDSFDVGCLPLPRKSMCEVSTLLFTFLHFTFYAYSQMRGQSPMNMPSPDRRSGALSSLGAGCVESEMGEPWVEGTRLLPCGSLRWKDGSRRLVIGNALIV